MKMTLGIGDKFKIGNKLIGIPKIPNQDRINDFSGGFPKSAEWPQKTIHTNLEFANNCGIASNAASGAMSEGYLIEFMIQLFGLEWLKYGTMVLKFIAIVKPNDIVTPNAIIKSHEIIDNVRIKIYMDIWCENQFGSVVVVGNAYGYLDAVFNDTVE